MSLDSHLQDQTSVGVELDRLARQAKVAFQVNFDLARRLSLLSKVSPLFGQELVEVLLFDGQPLALVAELWTLCHADYGIESHKLLDACWKACDSLYLYEKEQQRQAKYRMMAVIAILNLEHQWRQASGVLSWLTCYMATVLSCDVPVLEALYHASPLRLRFVNNPGWKAQPLSRASVEWLAHWCERFHSQLLNEWRISILDFPSRRLLSHCVLDLIGSDSTREPEQVLTEYALRLGLPLSPALTQQIIPR